MLTDPADRPVPLGTMLPPSEICEALAQRLRAETEGEVLFDTASRGRYATDASIYQIMPAGVLVPRNERDIATALQIARELKVPAARCRHQPMRPDGRRGAGHRQQQTLPQGAQAQPGRAHG
jgi:FAD/FMN-containing dehydrogenase